MSVAPDIGAPPGRWARAEVDLDAIAHNVALLRRRVAPAELWAVVKADGYGHGAGQVARAALEAGATGLCVALVAEGVELRRAGIDAPILLLSEQPVDQLDAVVAHDLTATSYSTDAIDALATAARSGGRSVDVHVKVDTGMQRVGAPPAAIHDLLTHLRSVGPSVRTAGLYTHLACADEPTAPANAEQLGRFDALLTELASAGLLPAAVHAANSAAGLALPEARRSLVRAGIAIYGISPGPGVDHLAADLRPAMRLAARISHVKDVAAGSHVSYGWRHRFERATRVATVPIGYADGVPRRLGTLPDRPGADVLVGGRRHPIVGVVTMDQLMIDVGDEPVHVGDEVVLIGAQRGERIRAEDWADRLGTIGYEIVCGVGPRVPRTYRSGGSGS